jgi:hypothetical protein
VVPRVRGIGEAVDQQHEWSGALLEIRELEAVRVHRLVSHGRERITTGFRAERGCHGA